MKFTTKGPLPKNFAANVPFAHQICPKTLTKRVSSSKFENRICINFVVTSAWILILDNVANAV